MIFQKVLKNSTRYYWFCLGIIVLLATSSVFPTLSASLWVDEPYSANLTYLSWADFFRSFRQDPATPLYYIVLKVWAAVFGDSEPALRTFSAICFALTILVTSITAWRIGGIFAGMAAAILAASSNIGLVFAGIARPYALLSLLTAVSLLIFLALIGLIAEHPLPRRTRILLAIGYISVNVLGLLTHPIFIFFIIACNFAVWITARPYSWIVSLCSLLSFGIFLAIWGSHLFHTLSLPALNWMEKPDIKDLIHSYLNLWGLKKTILLAVFIILASIWNFRLVRDFVNSQPAWIGGVMLLVMSLLPFLVSQYKLVFNDSRTPALYFPLACVVVALLAAKFKNRWLTFGFLITMFGYILISPFFVQPVSSLERSPRSTIQAMIENASCDDTFVSPGLSINETSYYLRRLQAHRCIENKVFPASMNDHPGWMDPQSLLEHRDELEKEADVLINTLESELPSGGRIWLFYEVNSDRQDVLDILKSRLDRRMVLTQTEEGYGSFFDQVLIYNQKE